MNVQKLSIIKISQELRIVRKAPPKPVNTVEKPERPSKGDKKPFNKQAGNEKKLVERRIIPQEIYEGKGGLLREKMMERKGKRF